jgi:hypothetical protein
MKELTRLSLSSFLVYLYQMQQTLDRSYEADFYHVAQFDKKLKADYVYHPDHHLADQFQVLRDELYFLPERLLYTAMKELEAGAPMEQVIRQSKKYHQDAFLTYFRKGLEILTEQEKQVTKEMLIHIKTGYNYMYPYYPMRVDSTGLVRGE